MNCPLTEKLWENPVYGTFSLYLPYAFFSACVLFIEIRQYLEEENPEETREKLVCPTKLSDKCPTKLSDHIVRQMSDQILPGRSESLHSQIVEL